MNILRQGRLLRLSMTERERERERERVHVCIHIQQTGAQNTKKDRHLCFRRNP